jgi:hypothetical protein
MSCSLDQGSYAADLPSDLATLWHLSMDFSAATPRATGFNLTDITIDHARALQL